MIELKAVLTPVPTRQRSRSRVSPLPWLLLLPLLILAGCSEPDSPTAAPPVAPDEVAAFQASIGGPTVAEGFHFLPPIHSNPTDPGSFDAGLAPVVEICEPEGCHTLHARFTVDGPGSERVRVDEDGEAYLVNWSTRRTGAEAGSSYGVRVRVGHLILGQVQVTVARP